MRTLIFVLGLFLIQSCADVSEKSDYTGREYTYALIQSADFPISGSATFYERNDGTTEIKVTLSGTEGDISHPVHFHYGNVSNPDAEIAIVLTPVFGKTGESITIVKTLMDETTLSYDDLVNFDGHIKIHLDDGPNKNTILAAGNIGSASKGKLTGRKDIAVCKSE
ncbi:hypothetical protein [Fulvivirga sp.]|uniref:hypothetical protein n=1 Tax=Fulvivirga sp. TaxID=1931237 RepID=UPI0032EF6852